MKDNISFAELAKKRQSDRKYKDQAVEREKLIQCLETARISPSANNSQPWKFIVVDDFEKKEQIAECSIGLGMNKFTHQCPVIVAVVLEKQNFMSTIGSMIKNKDYSLFDIGIAVNQFCLQAADLGLGTCIIGWFDEKKIKKILGVRNRRAKDEHLCVVRSCDKVYRGHTEDRKKDVNEAVCISGGLEEYHKDDTDRKRIGHVGEEIHGLKKIAQLLDRSEADRDQNCDNC